MRWLGKPGDELQQEKKPNGRGCLKVEKRDRGGKRNYFYIVS